MTAIPVKANGAVNKKPLFRSPLPTGFAICSTCLTPLYHQPRNSIALVPKLELLPRPHVLCQWHNDVVGAGRARDI